VRRYGSAALDLAWVAAGRYDGFWERGLKSWDMAAGLLLITEAGGKVTDLDGGEEMLESGNILAANLDMHPLIFEKLKLAA
jgi:myo-inositol-1(or 4)-monophosphatase